MRANSKATRGHKRDPIFVLIDAHSKAVKAAERAGGSLHSLEAKIDARPSEKRTLEELRLTCPSPYYYLGAIPPNHACVIKHRGKIRSHVYRVMDDAAMQLGRRAATRIRSHEREAIAELTRKYDAFLRAHTARRKACGLTARMAAVLDTESAVSAAFDALVRAKSQTPQGAIARATYISSLSPSQAPWGSLRAALEAITKELAP